MKQKIRRLAALFLCATISGGFADQTPFGIVYGPKAAFNITAPDGWLIDNSAGAAAGLPCVFFRKGQSWETAALMYAKIASTSYEDAEAFAKTAIEEMKKHARATGSACAKPSPRSGLIRI